jgi:CRISPR-associated protein Csm2
MKGGNMNTFQRGSPNQGARHPFGRRDGAHTNESPTIVLGDLRFDEPLNPKLFSDIAERVARDIAQGAPREANKSSQLRRFYDEFVMWQERVGHSNERFQHYQPFLLMLKAKVAYAKGRGHVDHNFEAFLRHLLDQCSNAERLRLGKLFFEAFMAFYKVHNNR